MKNCMGTHYQNIDRPSSLAAIACSAVFLIAGGCGSRRPVVDVPDAAARAIGEAGLIRFDPRGAPIDMPGDTPDMLSAPLAVRLALISDPAIQQALARVRAAEADADQSRLLPNPVLNFSYLFRQHQAAYITLGLDTDLLSYLLRPRQISIADNRLRAAAADALAVVLKSLAEVQEQYAAVQALDARLQVLAERRKIIEQLLHVGEARLNIGEGTRLDVLTLDTQRVALDAQIQSRTLDRINARLALARIIGRPSGRADWRVSPWQPSRIVVSDEQRWVRAALINRPEMQAGRWELAALGDQAALARFAAWEGTQLGPESERDTVWAVGPALTVPLPIFDQGQAKLKKARSNQIEARHKLTQISRQVVEEVRRAYQTFAASQKALRQMTGELLPLQELRRAQAQRAYRAGEADLATFLLAEQDLQTARELLVDVQQKSSVALFELQRTVGGPAVAARLEAPAPATGPATATVSAAQAADGPATSLRVH